MTTRTNPRPRPSKPSDRPTRRLLFADDGDALRVEMLEFGRRCRVRAEFRLREPGERFLAALRSRLGERFGIAAPRLGAEPAGAPRPFVVTALVLSEGADRERAASALEGLSAGVACRALGPRLRLA